MKKTGTTTRMLVPALIILGVLLVIAGFFQPWFSAKTSPELNLMSNSTLSMNVNLFGTVTATRTDQNVTKALTFGLSNTTAFASNAFQTISGARTDTSLTTSSPDLNTTDTVSTTITLSITGIGAYEGQVAQTDESVETIVNSTGKFTESSIKPFNDNFTTLTTQANQAAQMSQILPTAAVFTAVGLALSVIALALVLMVGRTERLVGRYAYLLGILGALFLLVAPLITYGNVTSFWGSLQLPSRTFLWGDQALMVWGASTGWYLTFTASLLIFACSLIVRSEHLERKRVLALQSLK